MYCLTIFNPGLCGLYLTLTNNKENSIKWITNINTMGSEEDSMVFFNALQVAEIDQFRIKSYLTVLDLTRLIFIYKLSRLKN